MSTNTTIFGVAYVDIVMVNTIGGGFMGNNIDVGTFADDGATPPVFWSATAGAGQLLVGGLLDKLVAVVGNNPAYVPPTE
jgi:hypothetical protein